MYAVFVLAVQLALYSTLFVPKVAGMVADVEVEASSQPLNVQPVRTGSAGLFTAAPNLPLTVCDVVPPFQLPSP